MNTLNISRKTVSGACRSSLKQLYGMSKQNSNAGVRVVEVSAQIEVTSDTASDNPIVFDGRRFDLLVHKLPIFTKCEFFNTEIDHYNKLFSNVDCSALIGVLEDDTTSNKAYCAVWSNTFIGGKTGDIPCMIGFHPTISNGLLGMTVHMRSNDAYKLLYIDMYFGIAIQNYIAEKLHIKKGTYVHQVSKLVLYSKDLSETRTCLASGN
jgi:hypothetical protein